MGFILREVVSWWKGSGPLLGSRGSSSPFHPLKPQPEAGYLQPGSSSSPEQTLLAPCSWTCNLQDWEKWIFGVYKSPILRYFVIQTRMGLGAGLAWKTQWNYRENNQRGWGPWETLQILYHILKIRHLIHTCLGRAGVNKDPEGNPVEMVVNALFIPFIKCSF